MPLMNTNWTKDTNNRFNDSRVLSDDNGKLLGFVIKKEDQRTSKSQWDCYIGNQNSPKVVGQRWTMELAQLLVEEMA